MIQNLDQLLEQAKSLGRKRVAVAAAQDKATLSALKDAGQVGLAYGELVGEESLILKILTELSIEKADFLEIHPVANEQQAATRAVQLVRESKADILLKGKTKTSTLLKSVLDPNEGLRTGRLLSDVFIFEDPRRQGNKLVMITDGGVNVIQELAQKVEILENAVEAAHALGNPCPKVALLAAVETVTPNMPSTLDAAAIAKMNQRGQIQGCIVDGPLGLDNAVSEQAAKEKGIDSPVAGRADILLCPNMESANLLAKGTTYFAGFRLAHVIMGAKAPVLIPSRSDTAEAKLLSIALGAIVSAQDKKGEPP